jgi:TonB family protein
MRIVYSKTVLRFGLLAAAGLGCVLGTNVLAQGKPVKWELLKGNNNELSVFMPEGNITIVDKDLYLGGSPKPAHIKTRLKIVRQLNGIVLLMTYYEGDARNFGTWLEGSTKATLESTNAINEFQVKRFVERRANAIHRFHHFLSKDRLYVLESYSTPDGERVVKGFFESVRLMNGSGIVAPNAPPGAAKTALPNLIEREMERLDDSQAITAEAVDQQAVILRMPRIAITPDMRLDQKEFQISAKILLSSSGKVTDVSIVKSSAGPIINREIVESMKKLMFVPAVKDGRLVSSYYTQEYSFRPMSTNIIVMSADRRIF